MFANSGHWNRLSQEGHHTSFTLREHGSLWTTNETLTRGIIKNTTCIFAPLSQIAKY